MKTHIALTLSLIGAIACGCSSSPKSDASDAPATLSASALSDLDAWTKKTRATGASGEVTHEEFVDHACDVYTHLDTNKDGILDQGEAVRLPAWATKAKKNKNGGIAIVDLTEEASTVFKKHQSKGRATVPAAQLEPQGGQ